MIPPNYTEQFWGRTEIPEYQMNQWLSMSKSALILNLASEPTGLYLFLWERTSPPKDILNFLSPSTWNGHDLPILTWQFCEKD